MRILLALALATSALAVRPPTPQAAHHARRAAETAIWDSPSWCSPRSSCRLLAEWGEHGGCLHGAVAAVEEWRRLGRRGRVILVWDSVRGHALAWLEADDPGYPGGGWCVDPRSEQWSPLEWCRSADVAVTRWRRSPGPWKSSGSGVMP